MEKGCRVNRGPLGALDSFEGSMCGITHKMSRSCMTIHDVKKEKFIVVSTLCFCLSCCLLLV